MMKKLIAVGALLTCLGVPAMAGEEGWTSDFEAAKKQAAESKKDLLMDFTGSDWCVWCTRLKDEVFSKDAFKNGVKDKFVLVELDFPRDGSKISPETKKQNEALAEKYGIEGFPTIILADAQGRPYAKTGYQPGGPENYVKKLDELRKKREARDEAFKKAESLEGFKKAEALAAALQALELSPAMEIGAYSDIVDEIIKNDPKDETGYAKKAKAIKKQAVMNKIGKAAMEHFQNKDFDGAIAYLDKAVGESGLDKEAKQQLLFLKVVILAEQEKFDEALEMLESVKAVAPESEAAGQFDQVRGQIEAAKKAKANQGGEKKEESKEETKEAPKPAKK